MEVHLGKFHSEQYDCGLCDYVATSLENIETHLFTCETKYSKYFFVDNIWTLN